MVWIGYTCDVTEGYFKTIITETCVTARTKSWHSNVFVFACYQSTTDVTIDYVFIQVLVNPWKVKLNPKRGKLSATPFLSWHATALHCPMQAFVNKQILFPFDLSLPATILSTYCYRSLRCLYCHRIICTYNPLDLLCCWDCIHLHSNTILFRESFITLFHWQNFPCRNQKYRL